MDPGSLLDRCAARLISMTRVCAGQSTCSILSRQQPMTSLAHAAPRLQSRRFRLKGAFEVTYTSPSSLILKRLATGRCSWLLFEMDVFVSSWLTIHALADDTVPPS